MYIKADPSALHRWNYIEPIIDINLYDYAKLGHVQDSGKPVVSRGTTCLVIGAFTWFRVLG